MHKFVFKINGKPLSDEIVFEKLIRDIHKLILENNSCVLIHGGGDALSEYCEEQRIEMQYDSQGQKITSAEEMFATDMILSGSINTTIIRFCAKLGVRAIGLSCVDHNLLIGESVNDTFTGKVSKVNTSILDLFSSQHILPVICTVSSTEDGRPLIINADDVALYIATHWRSHILTFLSDVEGVKIGDAIVPHICSSDVPKYIESGEITGSMVGKINNTIEAIHKGMGAAVIGKFQKENDIAAFLNNTKGTKIMIC